MIRLGSHVSENSSRAKTTTAAAEKTMSELNDKYRPQVFEDVLGQELASAYLSRRVKEKKPRNVLIYGPWGVGKTTLASIYAKALYCERPSETGSPCCECTRCHDFDSQGIGNYFELNAATHSGIETIKDLQDTIRHYPLDGWWVIVMDEVHNTSPKGFEALLKTLEQPPSSAVFVLITTEIAKIPDKIRSRCHELETFPLDFSMALNHLRKICLAESFAFENEALELIVEQARGHARDLVKNLELVADYGAITQEMVRRVLKLDYVESLVRYLRALLIERDLEKQQLIIDEWSDDVAKKFGAI
jgi:DNA polymerase III subunit gamma/tau